MAERDESLSVVERVRDAATSAGRRGETLPGEPTLAEALGVSRPTVREALVRLEAEGLIRRRKGADTIVNPGAVEMVARFDQQVEYADLLRGAGFEPSVEVLEAGVRGLSVEAAEQLEREPGSLALRTVKRWRADGQAVMVAVDVVPARPGEESRLAELDPTRGLFELVRQLTGDVVEWELAWPGAELLRAPVRGWLEADRNQAVLTLDLVGITRRAHRAYHALEYHVPGAVPSGFVRTVRS